MSNTESMLEIVERLNQVVFEYNENCGATIVMNESYDAVMWQDIVLWDSENCYMGYVEADESDHHPNYEDCRASLIAQMMDVVTPFVKEVEAEKK